MRTSKMVCAACGAEMNHHAEKLDYSIALNEPEAVDADLGAVLEEVHTCPSCASTGTRRAPEARR